MDSTPDSTKSVESLPNSQSKLASLAHSFPEEDLRQSGVDNPGYYPARLGQEFHNDGRYVIVRKLGWGKYSSVWLARDCRNERFVTFKILTCEGTRALLDEGSLKRSDEVAMLEKVARADPAHRGFRHNLAYYKSFDFRGPHGLHRCLVTEALGFGVEYLREEDDPRFGIDLVKHIVKQILLGLEYLHDACGIVHADIKHDNILFRPGDLEAAVRMELAEVPSSIYGFTSEINPPVIPVRSQVLPLSLTRSTKWYDLDVVIADLGHSHWQQRHFQEQIQPLALRAPEVILGYPWGTSADIWNLGCLVIEWLTGGWLFRPAQEELWDIDEDHLARMTEALGESFGLSLLANCSHRDKFFNPDGSFAHFTEHKEPTMPLRDLLETFSTIEDCDIEPTEKFLRRCLQLDPSKRGAAKELIDDPWFEDM